MQELKKEGIKPELKFERFEVSWRDYGDYWLCGCGVAYTGSRLLSFTPSIIRNLAP
jgi:hypothetical protein